MTNAQKNSPMLKAAGLWAKTSGKGGQYLTGRLGGLKVLILENRDRKSDDDPSHHLFFVEAPDRRQERGDGDFFGGTPRFHRSQSGITAMSGRNAASTKPMSKDCVQSARRPKSF